MLIRVLCQDDMSKRLRYTSREQGQLSTEYYTIAAEEILSQILSTSRQSRRRGEEKDRPEPHFLNLFKIVACKIKWSRLSCVSLFV